MAKTWFEVDKQGLAKLMAGRSKAFVLYELLQNAWDQDVTEVNVAIDPLPGRPSVIIKVRDDDPNGFADLRDAYTLFAESRKKSDASKRGRFNVGEKMVLALANEATIITTTGGVRFDSDGRHTLRAKTERGSTFEAILPMTREELAELETAVTRVIPPVPTTFNGERLLDRYPIIRFEATLPTLVSDESGVMRKSLRKTMVQVYEPVGTAMLYEMGIPVVESGDRYDIDIGQKVPLNMDRDNVTPAFLRAVRVEVLNHTHDRLKAEDVTQTWVREACADTRISDEAVRQVMKQRFGERAVIYDPSDLESNKRSVADGRPVVYGGNLSAGEWENVRRSEALLPAGVVTPTPKPFHPDGKPLAILEEHQLTVGMKHVRRFCQEAAEALLGHGVIVQFTNDPQWFPSAVYGTSRELIFNVGKLGKRWFEVGISDAVIDLVIHEFGHDYEADHLSREYNDVLTKLGAKMTRFALEFPEAFR